MSAAYLLATDGVALRAALSERALQFRQALRQGGSRDEFRAWQASDEALQIALALLACSGSDVPAFSFSTFVSGV